MPTTATAYLFSELSEDAKKTAIEKCRTDFVEFWDWWQDDFYYYQNEVLPEEGFEVSEDKNGPDIFFQGFWSQGDGASFEADVDVYKFMRKNKLCNDFRSLAHWVREQGLAHVNIYRGGPYANHYYHENTMHVEHEFEYYAVENERSADAAEAQLEELAGIILSKAREMAKKLYNTLEKTYEEMTSDDFVAEHLEINGFYFWHNGIPAVAAAFEE